MKIGASVLVLIVAAPLGAGQDWPNASSGLSVEERVIARLPDSFEFAHPNEDQRVYTDPQQRRLAYVVREKGQEWVVIDGRAQRPYEEIKSFYLDDGGPPPPSRRYVQFSPDGRRYAYNARQGKRYFLIVDGEQLGPYDEAVEPMFSTNGRLAYVVTRYEPGRVPGVEHIQAGCRVILDGIAHKEYTSCGRLTFSPSGERFAYIVWLDDFEERLVVTDGVEGRRYQGLPLPWLQFSENGDRLGYFADRDNRSFLVINGREYPAPPMPYYGKMSREDFDQTLAFGEGKRYAYVADTSRDPDTQEAWVVDTGRRGKSYAFTGFLTFSPNGKRLAYVAHDAEMNERIVLDGRESAVQGRIVRFHFSPDSRHLAFIAWSEDERFVVLDGKVVSKTLAHRLTFSPDSRRLAFISRETGDEGKVMILGEGPTSFPINGVPYEPTLVFSLNSRHVAYKVERRPYPSFRIGIDGEESGLYDGPIDGSRLMFEASDTLRTVARRGRDVILVKMKVR